MSRAQPRQPQSHPPTPSRRFDIPNIDLHYALDTITPSGLIIPGPHGPARSFVTAMLRHIYIAWGFTAAGIRDTSNIVRTVPLPQTLSLPWFLMLAPAASQLYGLVVGTSLIAPDVEDYSLVARITHGNAAGQLYYQADTIDAPVTAAPSQYINVYRTFDNNSGGAITINEVGIYCITYDSGSVARYFCLARDLPAAPITAPNGGGARLTYTVTITV